MTESLRDVLAKVKQQREAEKNKKNENVEEPTIIEETKHEIEKPALKPLSIPAPMPEYRPEIKQIPVPDPAPIPNYKPSFQDEQIKTETEILMDEIEMMHNNGIFRRELIYKLNKISKSLDDLIKILGGL